MKAHIIPPPERVDDRTQEQKQRDLEILYKHIKITNQLRIMTAAAGFDYREFPGSPVVPDNFGERCVLYGKNP